MGLRHSHGSCLVKAAVRVSSSAEKSPAIACASSSHKLRRKTIIRHSNILYCNNDFISRELHVSAPILKWGKSIKSA